MFSNEEQLFLSTISKMLSPNNKERNEAEENIKKWMKETYLQVLQACNKFIICENIKAEIRRYCCFILEFLTKENNYENWQKVNIELKTSVQNNSLGLLGDKDISIRQSACSLVNSISIISIKDQGWPNLVKILCGACKSDNIEFKISAARTLGLIWESLPKEGFSLEELALMENTIIELLNNPQNEKLSIECLKAYKFFMNYIKNKFIDKNYLESALKMLISYCNLNNEEIGKLAIHDISNLFVLAYDYFQPHFKNISEYFIILCTGNNEFLAVQSYVLFTEFSNEEIERKNKKINCRNYIKSIWNNLWPCIQHSLDNRIFPRNDDMYTRYDALYALLYDISLLCDENVIDDIFSYMGAKLNDNNPLKINSAIYAFSSIIETIHKNKIRSVIPDSIKSIIHLFGKKFEELNETLSFCIQNICQTHAKLLIKNTNLFNELIKSICTLLNDQSLNNKTKMHLCESIYYLGLYIFDENLQSFNIFSPYLKDLLGILESLAYLPSSYDPEKNLSYKCFQAIAFLIECSTEKDKVLVSFFMDKIYARLNEAQNIQNFDNSKSKMEDFQSYLCLITQSLCKNRINNLINLDNQKIESYFNIIENFFKMRNGVFEEGFLALSSLITLISNNQYEKLIERIMVYVLFALDNYRDAKNCQTACLCLIDIINTAKEKFIPYINKIYPLFDKIIKAEDIDKHIFTLIIIVYSDLFGNIGESIWTYYEQPMNYMNQIINFSINDNKKYLDSKIDSDEYNYFIKLNCGLVDFIQNVTNLLAKCDENKKEAFKQYIPDISNYLIEMMGNSMFNPNNDYLISCLYFLISLADIYKKYILKQINDFTLQRIFQLANESEDDNIINLKDYFQNLIFTIKIQS